MAAKGNEGQGKKKGLPNRAARSHPSHARREKSHFAGLKRKAERREEQEERAAMNRDRVRNGEPSAWELAKARRAARRDADPFIIRKRRLHMAQALKMPTDAGHRA